MDDASNDRIERLRDRLEELDQNQQRLLQLIKDIGDKVKEVDAADGDAPADVDGEGGRSPGLNQLRSRLGKLSSREEHDIKELRQDIERLSEQLEEPDEDVMADIEEFRQELEDLHDKQDRIASGLGNLRELMRAEEGDDAEDILSRFQERSEELEATIYRLEKMFNDVGAMRQETSILVEGVEEELDDVEDRVGTVAIEEKRDVARLEEELRELREEVEDRSELHGLEDRVATAVEPRIDRLEELTESASRRMARVQASLADVEDRVDTLRGEEDAESLEVAELGEELDALADAHARAEEEIGDLADEISRAPERSRLAEVADRLEENRGRVEELSETVDNMENATIAGEVDDLRSRLSDLSDLVLELAEDVEG